MVDATPDTIASARSLRARGFSEDAIGAMLKLSAGDVMEILEKVYSRKIDKNRTVLEAIDSCKEIEKDLALLITDEKKAAGGADRKLLLEILKTKVTIQDKKSDLINKIREDGNPPQPQQPVKQQTMGELGKVMTLFDDLWQLWKNYIGWYVVGNEHLKRAFFHVILGCMLTNRECYYVESAQERSTRMHTFIIQNSGTGKSQTMKAARDLLLALKVPAGHTTKDNEAAAIGTIWRDKKEGKFHIKKGRLSELLYYSWDEGSVLLKPSSYTDMLTDHFQRAMDEPGEVSKSLAMGTIEYKTKATLIAGSYMFREFRKTLLEKGFLQRMHMVLKTYSPEEERENRIGVNLLKLLTDRYKVNKIITAFKIQAEKIPKGKILTFNNNDTRKFNEVLEKVYQEEIEYIFTGEKQRVLKTFFNRLHILMDKVATQKALLSGHDEVLYEDMMYAYDYLITDKYVPNSHMKNLHELLEGMSMIGEQNMQQNRVNILIDKVRNTTSINQKQLLVYLKQLYSNGKWDCGSSKSRTLIQDLVKEGIFGVVKGEKNENLLCVL